MQWGEVGYLLVQMIFTFLHGAKRKGGCGRHPGITAQRRKGSDYTFTAAIFKHIMG
jgi:hypothetical protein